VLQKISTAEIEKYPLLAKEKILNAAEHAVMKLKAGTFCMVISGHLPQSQSSAGFRCCERSKVKYNLIYLPPRLLSEEQTYRLAGRQGGSGKSQPQYPQRATTPKSAPHNFGDRVDTLKHVKAAGITTCSGELSAWESDDDVINLAFSFRS